MGPPLALYVFIAENRFTLSTCTCERVNIMLPVTSFSLTDSVGGSWWSGISLVTENLMVLLPRVDIWLCPSVTEGYISRCSGRLLSDNRFPKYSQAHIATYILWFLMFSFTGKHCAKIWPGVNIVSATKLLKFDFYILCPFSLEWYSCWLRMPSTQCSLSLPKHPQIVHFSTSMLH